MRRSSFGQKTWTGIVLGILFFAGLFVVSMVLETNTDLPWSDWRSLLSLILLFAVLGAYFGTIVMLDGKSGLAPRDRPLIRTGLCGVLSASAVLILQSRPPHSLDARWVIVGFIVGAVLGWLGWTWAKHVDF